MSVLWVILGMVYAFGIGAYGVLYWFTEAVQKPHDNLLGALFTGLYYGMLWPIMLVGEIFRRMRW